MKITNYLFKHPVIDKHSAIQQSTTVLFSTSFFSTNYFSVSFFSTILFSTILLLLFSFPSFTLAANTTISQNYTANSVSPKITRSIVAEISLGELIDKITILRIKQEQIKDTKKLRNVNVELKLLYHTLCEIIAITPELLESMDHLKKINYKLWVVEDDIRIKECKQEFDEAFIELARLVYITNDERCTIKRIINELYGSHLIEEKSYVDYVVAQ